MKKRILAMLVAIVLVLSVLPVQALAARDNTFYADELHALGLFDGMGKNPDGTPIYNLEGSLTRAQAFVMLTRLLGEEKAALAYTGSHPFTDCVNHWAGKEGYIGYCYSKGYLEGMTETTCEPDTACNANMFLTLLLRALGYSDSGGDFNYSTAYVKAAEVGMIGSGEYSSGGSFLRGDLVYTSYMALSVSLKGGSMTLLESLIEKGAVTEKSEPKTLWEFMDGVLYLCHYDESGRLVMRIARGSVDFFDFYRYDSAGNLTAIIDWNDARLSAANNAITLDSSGRVIYSECPEADSRVDYEYDAAGRPVLERYSYGYLISYKYNSLGQMISMEEAYAGSGLSSTQTYEYDSDGRVARSTVHYQYEDAYSYFAYEYDSEGRLISRERDFDDTMFIDDLTEYVYGSGRPLEFTTTLTGAEAGYTGETAATVELGYDGNGRLTRFGSCEFTYDAEGTLTDAFYRPFDDMEFNMLNPEEG